MCCTGTTGGVWYHLATESSPPEFAEFHRKRTNIPFKPIHRKRAVIACCDQRRSIHTADYAAEVPRLRRPARVSSPLRSGGSTWSPSQCSRRTS